MNTSAPRYSAVMAKLGFAIHEFRWARSHLPPADSWIPKPGFGMTALRNARASLLGRANLFALLVRRRGAFSFLFRVRLRHFLRRVRLAAEWCRGVGDDVEIVCDGLHGGSSF